MRHGNFFIIQLSLLLLAGACEDPDREDITGSRPNILLIVADDMGYSDAGCYGGELDTPNLDNLAKNGIRFSNFYVNPMCTVTRTSLLTGQEHYQSNQRQYSYPIARMLKAAGYHTSVSGKWHQPVHPLDDGFDSFYGFLDGSINAWNGALNGPQIQTDREPPAPVGSPWYSSDAFADHTIRQIDFAIQEQKPFFAYLAFNAPHYPELPSPHTPQGGRD